MEDLPAMRQSADNVLALSLFFLFFADFVHSAICFYNAFPNGYVWGELFIKYTDGPVRRGLTGYLLYKSAAFLNIHVFWTLFVSTVYMLFFIRAYTFIRSSVSYFFTIILFFSPALLAFLVKDPDLYGRKDILFLGLLTIIMAKAGAIIIAPEKQGKAWLTIALCYLVAFLVHEITLFFSLLPALLVLRAGGRHRLPVLAANGSVFLVSVLFAVHFQGTETMREAMFRDWQALIPDFTTQERTSRTTVRISKISRPIFAYSCVLLFRFFLRLRIVFLLDAFLFDEDLLVRRLVFFPAIYSSIPRLFSGVIRTFFCLSAHCPA